MLGGPRAVPRELGRVDWPVVTEADRDAVLRVLDSGRLVANADGEEEVPALEREWAAQAGVPRCLAVASGTAALQLALSALGVGPGDEVLVPALSFAATALAALHQGAAPVFVDVRPDSFNLDPDLLEPAITERTRAVVAVHLHGLPADMDRILAVAARHGLPVVEDAAQAHGAVYRGRPVGSLGAAGCFSLNATKNLPTCGEGGLVTTASPDLARRMERRRLFGEELRAGEPRRYLSLEVGWNHKLSPVQAAFARSQLDRFAGYEARRQANVRAFLDRLAGLPGLVLPACPEDRSHVWHILRFRLDPCALGLDAPAAALRRALHRALRAEGVPVSRYQEAPLPVQAAFGGADPARFPVAAAALDGSLCLQRRQLNPDAGELLQRCADGFEKVWQHLDVVAGYARALGAGA